MYLKCLLGIAYNIEFMRTIVNTMMWLEDNYRIGHQTSNEFERIRFQLSPINTFNYLFKQSSAFIEKFSDEMEKEKVLKSFYKYQQPIYK